MLPARRAWGLATIAGLIAVWVSATAQSTDTALRKQEVVRAALAKNGAGEPSAKLLETADKSAAIVSAELRGEASTPVLTLAIEGAPEFDWFYLDKGKRVVVDFYDAVYFESGKTLTAASESTYLKTVRSSIYTMEPRFVARFVLDLKKEAKPSIDVADGKVLVSLISKKSSDKASKSKKPQTEPTVVAAESAKTEPDRPANALESFAAELARMDRSKDSDSSEGNLTNADAKTVSPVNVSEETKVASQTASMDKTGIKAVEPAAIDQLPSTIQTPSAVVVATGEAQKEAKKDEDPFAKMRSMLQQLSAEREKSQGSPETQKPEPPAAQPSIAPKPSTPEKVEEPTSDAKASANVTVVVDKAEVEEPSPATNEKESSEPLMLAAATPAAPKEERTQVAQATQEPLPASPEPEAKPVEKLAPFKGLREALEAEKKSSEAAANSSAEAPQASPPTPSAPPEEKKTVKPLKPVQSEPLVPEMDEPERVKLPAGMDPMDQLVNIDFREMDLSQVVSLLAKKAGVNVIAGTDVVGTVTADMKNIPLRKAMDMVLRMNGLGIVEEEGIYRIVTYDEAVAARRATQMVALKNAQSEDVKTTLDGVLVGSPDATAMAVSANSATNVIIISGPREKVEEYVKLANDLDIKEPTLPTVTEAVKLNYLEPKAAKPIAESMITKDLGKVEIDEIGRHLVITDIPVVVEQIREMLTSVDIPVKQVAIDAMIVDVVLRDASQTGVNWLLEALRRHSTNGDLVSDVSQLDFESTLGNIGTEALDAGVLTLGILSSEARLTSSIAAEVQSRNAEILANPSVVTVENKPATISIVQEFPYQEITQGLTGPPVASTEFKPIGVTLEVTPRVTHDKSTIVEVQAKQSSVSGLTESGVPIEDKREAQTTLRAQDGRTIFIGGLRNVTDRLSVSKVPVLGDIPVLNLAFRSRDLEKINTELLIFLTCRVMGEELPELSPAHQDEFNKIGLVPDVPDSQRAMFRDIAKPQEMRDPAWKWRRSK